MTLKRFIRLSKEANLFPKLMALSIMLLMMALGIGMLFLPDLMGYLGTAVAVLSGVLYKMYVDMIKDNNDDLDR